MVEYACALVRETRRSTWLNLLCRSTANQPGSPASLAILAAIRRASSRVLCRWCASPEASEPRERDLVPALTREALWIGLFRSSP
jgi:hypothetical protein